jgi:hypothetical protein
MTINSVAAPNKQRQNTNPAGLISSNNSLINKKDIPQIALNVNKALYSFPIAQSPISRMIMLEHFACCSRFEKAGILLKCIENTKYCQIEFIPKPLSY